MNSLTQSFQTGLIVGKFCPLHRGHEFLIETALSVCERLVVISYAKPEHKGCERNIRSGWFEELYPSVSVLIVDDDWLQRRVKNFDNSKYTEIPDDDAPDTIHRLFTAWLCYDVLGEMPDAVFTSEDYGDGFADVLSKYFSEDSELAKPVAHICVDKARKTVPISGTQIRQNPYKHREYLSYVVYRSFVKKIVLLGGESTGKSTLAKALAQCLDTQWVPEYGRDLWEQRDGQLVYDDMLHIAQTQILHEDNTALQAKGWLVCDTSPLTTLF